MSRSELIKVLNDIADKVKEDTGYLVQISGCDIPNVPVIVKEVIGEYVYIKNISMSEDLKFDIFSQFKIKLDSIFKIRLCRNDEVLWVSDDLNWELLKRLEPTPVNVEFDLRVDSRYIHLKGIAECIISPSNGEKMIAFKEIYDGVKISKRAYKMSDVKNVKIIGGI